MRFILTICFWLAIGYGAFKGFSLLHDRSRQDTDSPKNVQLASPIAVQPSKSEPWQD